VDLGPESPELIDELLADTVILLRVPRDRAEALRDALGSRFDLRANQALYNQVMEMHFIPDAEHYGLLHNCNHVTARWLSEMGCQIRGNPITSKFKLAPAPEAH
jgi:hypothetical protein